MTKERVAGALHAGALGRLPTPAPPPPAAVKAALALPWAPFLSWVPVRPSPVLSFCMLPHSFDQSFLKNYIYLFLERGEGREKEKERNVDV